jgi:hypothetical protein
MFVTTITVGAAATPLVSALVQPDKIAPFQTLVVAASAAAYMGDANVSATNGIPIGTTPLVIPANHLQYASDLQEIYFFGSGVKVTVMVFG